MSEDLRVYRAEEVAYILQMRVTEVYRAAKAGELPGRIRIGRRTRFAKAEIDRLVRARKAGGER
jgi:predicted DNA-binding transcriptional regulator AlpA